MKKNLEKPQDNRRNVDRESKNTAIHTIWKKLTARTRNQNLISNNLQLEWRKRRSNRKPINGNWKYNKVVGNSG